MVKGTKKKLLCHSFSSTEVMVSGKSGRDQSDEKLTLCMCLCLAGGAAAEMMETSWSSGAILGSNSGKCRGLFFQTF